MKKKQQQQQQHTSMIKPNANVGRWHRGKQEIARAKREKKINDEDNNKRRMFKYA